VVVAVALAAVAHATKTTYSRKIGNPLRKAPPVWQFSTGGALRYGKERLMKESSKVRKIAFVGDHLPRKCGIATFTSDLLAAVADAYPQSQCLSVSVNNIKGAYEYPEVVRFEIEEQDLSSYPRAGDFLNISNVDIVCLQHVDRVNRNEGAESTLAFLLSLAETRLAQNMLTSFKQPIAVEE
jgi:hypothetical protein